MTKISPLSALLQRAVWLWNQLFGWPSVIAVLALLASWVMYSQFTPHLEQERATLAERRAARSAAISTVRSNRPINAQESAAAFVDSLPSAKQRSGDIAVLLDAARTANLVVERADYSVQQEPNVPILRLKATLPVKGSYSDIRSMATQVLNKLPHAALESMQLERANASATQLDAVLQLNLLYRVE